MKSTGKSSETQIFHYLSEEYVRSPIKYVQWFYRTYKFAAWQEYISLFLAPGPVSTDAKHFDPVQTHRHLVNHIDVAYAFRTQPELDPVVKHFLQGFFDFTPRERWVEILNQQIAVKSKNNLPDYRADTHSELRSTERGELLLYLSYYYALLAQGREKEFKIPQYVIPGAAYIEACADPSDPPSRLDPPLTDPPRGGPPKPGFAHVGHGRRVNSLSPDLSAAGDPPCRTFPSVGYVRIPHWLRLPPFSAHALQELFQIDSLAGWKDAIWHWYQAVIIDDRYWSGADPNYSGVHLLELYAHISSLFDMYRAHNTSEPEADQPPSDSHQRSIFREQDPLRIRHGQTLVLLHYVSKDEATRPLEAVLALIGEHSKSIWDEMLYEWLSYGLSANTLPDIAGRLDPARLYQVLIKMIELSYLLAFANEPEIEFEMDDPIHKPQRSVP